MTRSVDVLKLLGWMSLLPEKISLSDKCMIIILKYVRFRYFATDYFVDKICKLRLYPNHEAPALLVKLHFFET